MIRSSRGKPQILLNGFSYRKHRLLSNGASSWRCTKKNCRSRLRVCESSGMILSILSHNHEADYSDVNKRAFKSLLRNKAKSCSESSRTVLNEAVQEMNSPSTEKLAKEKEETLRTLIRRTRKKCFPTTHQVAEKKVTIGTVQAYETKAEQNDSLNDKVRFHHASYYATRNLHYQNLYLQKLVGVCDQLPLLVHYNLIPDSPKFSEPNQSVYSTSKKFLNPVLASLGKPNSPQYVFITKNLPS